MKVVCAIALTVAYTFRGTKRTFFSPMKPNLLSHEIKDPPLTMSVPLLLTGVVSIILGLYPKVIMDLFHFVIGGLLPS